MLSLTCLEWGFLVSGVYITMLTSYFSSSFERIKQEVILSY